MDKLLQSNIKNSLRIVAEEQPKVPEHLIEVVEQEPGGPGFLAEAIVKMALQPIPWFYRDSSHELQSPQQSFLGFYAVRNALRGIFLGLRFIQAGDLLRENKFLAASVFSYYTASFHLLNSFLALNGRIMIEPVHGPPTVVKRAGSAESSFRLLDPMPEVIVAILTRHNTWKFEPRPRSHTRRWRELEPIFVKLGDNIPDFFLSFFEYTLSYGEYNLFDDKTSLRDGLQRLTQIRHESIYVGYGFDDFVYDGIINRDLDSSCGIDLKSEAYRSFAVDLLTFSANEFVELKNSIPCEHWNKTRTLLAGSTFMPPFEVEGLQLAGEPELSKTLGQILSWLITGSPPIESW